MEELSTEDQALMDQMEAADAAPEPDPTGVELEPEQSQAEPEADGGKPPPGMVPHGALHKERSERKEAASQLNEERATTARLERELAEMRAQMQALQSPPKPEEAAPEWVDPIYDPEGYRKYQEYHTQQTQQRFDELANFQQQTIQQQQMQAYIAQVEAEFVAEQPDYMQAVDHMRNAREQQLQAQGYRGDQISQQLGADRNSILQAAQLLGVSPAKLAYQRALEMGYQPAPAPAEAEAERIAALSNAQRQTQGIGTGGSAQAGGMTVEDLANLSEAEFAKIPQEERDRLMGG
jgi:hypothetical protein